jgi:hypothetical protein
LVNSKRQKLTTKRIKLKSNKEAYQISTLWCRIWVKGWNWQKKPFIILNTLVQNYALSVQGFSCYTFLRLDMARIRILDKMKLKLFSKLYFTRL